MDKVLCFRNDGSEFSRVHFSAIAPRTLIKGDYTIIDIVMYQDAFRSVVDELIKEAEVPVHETRSGAVKVKEGVKVKIQLSSPDIPIEDNIEEQEWAGEYLIFNFAVMLPEKYVKRQVLFTATVYIDDVIATRLKFVAKCWSLRQQKIKVMQEDVLSAFVSYASQDRNRVAMIIQGMQKARPDMDIFFDVESLRKAERSGRTLYGQRLISAIYCFCVGPTTPQNLHGLQESGNTAMNRKEQRRLSQSLSNHRQAARRRKN